MHHKIKQLVLMVEQSEVSHRECAELVTLVKQMEFYVGERAAMGDLYAANIAEQLGREDDAKSFI